MCRKHTHPNVLGLRENNALSGYISLNGILLSKDLLGMRLIKWWAIRSA